GIVQADQADGVAAGDGQVDAAAAEQGEHAKRCAQGAGLENVTAGGETDRAGAAGDRERRHHDRRVVVDDFQEAARGGSDEGEGGRRGEGDTGGRHRGRLAEREGLLDDVERLNGGAGGDAGARNRLAHGQADKTRDVGDGGRGVQVAREGSAGHGGQGAD